ncbi:hypothetical protein SISSUDRAFT_1127345 [Sistotremastrum suecicum HHB10207 ss-3]|uniref:F-box domain-containing protein n=1 Tax=Sistotremastrum suecicum HHB10207 ss-3 TaxID=1314776 RepID=A0A166F666_9AGAM|nr:hypothetical protein SISSUDRAFT_1127345 [Sistotremastrum suecicum HHB10207 ss-3]
MRSSDKIATSDNFPEKILKGGVELLAVPRTGFNIQCPVEIWGMIIRDACDPLTEAEMLEAVEDTELYGNPSVRERDTQLILCLVLTCRKFAELALPFLFQVPDTLASESTSKSNLTLTTLNLLSTLALPIPKLENSNARSHGELVRFLSLGRAPALDYKKILHDCPNVTHLMCFVTRSSRDWLPVLSHMKSLVALRIAAFEPLCAVNDHSVVTFPNLETLGLQIQHDRAWGTDHWDLPRLRRLSLMCRESRDKTRISRFLEQHHRTLEFLYCDPVLEDPTLTSAEDFFPRLTHRYITLQYHPP